MNPRTVKAQGSEVSDPFPNKINHLENQGFHRSTHRVTRHPQSIEESGFSGQKRSTVWLGAQDDGMTCRLKRLQNILCSMLTNLLTQAQVAKLMGTQTPAIARLESSLATGKHSPSINTIKRYAAALGKKLELHLV